MPEKPLSLLVIMFAFILLANCSNAVVVVKSGERIQAAIDAAHSGETIWPAVAVMSGFCFRCTATTGKRQPVWLQAGRQPGKQDSRKYLFSEQI
jgi:hypothetical protein